MRSRIFVVLLLFFLVGCGGGDVRDDIPLVDIAQAIDEALGDSVNLSAQTDSYIKGYVKLASDTYEECIIKSDAYSETVDEYGIIKGSDEKQTDEIEASVGTYLKMRRDSWIDAYMPEEKPKVVNAEYKRTGNYIIFVILSDASRATAIEAFDSALK